MKTTIKSENIHNQKGGEKKMKYSKSKLAIGAGIFTLAAVAFIGSSWATENVRQTKHNLSVSRTIDNNLKFSETTEVCVFCHTPHGGRTDVAGGSAPLWNRALSKATYVIYDSPNFDDGANNAGQPRGVSVACLSCHDGTVAFDSLVNLSGSGGYIAGNDIGGVGNVRAGWTATGTYVTDGKVVDGAFAAPAGPFPMLGTDLSNDHPVSMRICNGTTAHDPQFEEACTNSSAPTNNPGILKISRGGTREVPTDIRDTIRAYKSDPTGDASGWYIECASCHNPHEGTATRFLRYPTATPQEKTDSGLGLATAETDRNKGSLVCLSCHQK
ncbi:MAG: hypothetical protein IT392_07465 [Nitrospirae bacterium]|nr:hypothetical protein [Nitrospirota bacterium]